MKMTDFPDQNRLYSAFRPRISAYIHARIPNRADAEDLVSDVLVKLWQGRASYQENKGSLSTWIYAITRNVVTDYFRTHRSPVSLTEEIACTVEIEESLCHEEELESLARALKILSRTERDLIVLYYYGERTLKAVAEMMNMPYSTAKFTHRSALRKLKEEMQRKV